MVQNCLQTSLWMCRRETSSILFLSMTLIATSSPVNKCFALLTIANLPLREILMIFITFS